MLLSALEFLDLLKFKQYHNSTGTCHYWPRSRSPPDLPYRFAWKTRPLRKRIPWTFESTFWAVWHLRIVLSKCVLWVIYESHYIQIVHLVVLACFCLSALSVFVYFRRSFIYNLWFTYFLNKNSSKRSNSSSYNEDVFPPPRIHKNSSINMTSSSELQVLMLWIPPNMGTRCRPATLSICARGLCGVISGTRKRRSEISERGTSATALVVRNSVSRWLVAPILGTQLVVRGKCRTTRSRPQTASEQNKIAG